MFIVDAVSSMSAIQMDFDTLGIDVLLAGTQKAFALPPGLAVFVCSPAALARAAQAKDRGYYFDFLEFQKNAEQSMTPSTPSIGHIYALAQNSMIFSAKDSMPVSPGIKTWPKTPAPGPPKNGFNLFPEPGFESVTLTCINNGAKPGGRSVDVAKLQKLVKDQGILVDGGYGKIKAPPFASPTWATKPKPPCKRLYGALDVAMKQL